MVMIILTICTLANAFMSLRITLENKITSMQNVMKQLKYNSDMIARLSDLLFRISNDVRGVGKHACMVQIQLEQVAKSQRELLEEMNNNINDHEEVK